MANAKYRLTPLKERMVGYLETVGASQVIFEGSFDEATKVAVELLYSNKDFLQVDITKIGKTVMASKKVGKVTSQGVFKYGLGGALIFIGLGVAGVMAYNSYKNQAPEGEYKVKLYKKGTLQDTLIFNQSYVNKATEDFKKLGYVVRVAKIKTMAEGGGVGGEVYIEFLNKDKGFKKEVKHFNSYEEAVKWGRENFDNFNSDMIHYKMAEGGGVMSDEEWQKHIKQIIENLNKSLENGSISFQQYQYSISNLQNPRGFSKGGSVITYKNKYNKKYGYDKNESHSLEDIAKDTKISIKGLQQIYDKGIGAYKTNPQSVRPNVKSKEQWAMARVYSAVMGGKASKVDENELKMLNGGRVKTIKEADIKVGAKFELIDGQIIEITRLFKENIDQDWCEFIRGGETKESSVNALKIFINNWRAEKKFGKGGGIESEFDKGMVLNNLDMIKEYSVAIDKMVTENTKLDEWVKMKLTKVEQNMADIKHAIEGFNKYGEGGQIFKKQLLHISKYATDIKKMVSGKKEVMSWIEGKLFLSADYMDTLYHFLDYESGNTASKYRKGGKLDTEYVVYDWDTYNKLSTHKTIESAKKRMYELYKEKKNLHLAVKNLSEFEQTKNMLQMKDGGSIEESSKVGLHLPMEISVYVPSTKDANVPVSKAELSARVKEVKQYLATLFGGYSSSEILGGYVSTTGELIQEDVVKVISFATKQAYEDNEATLIDKIADWSKEWSQEAIGLEIEGDLYYINQTQETFRNGGSLGGFEYTIGGL
jgi:hypothetical protein